MHVAGGPSARKPPGKPPDKHRRVKTLLQRNVLLLLGAQLVFVAGSSMTVTMGGIVGSRLAPSPSLATLPVSLMVLGTALGTVPASLLMQRLGRRLGLPLLPPSPPGPYKWLRWPSAANTSGSTARARR